MQSGKKKELKGGLKAAESLVDVLNDAVLRDAFSYFLEERHTEENLQLWLALEDYNEVFLTFFLLLLLLLLLSCCFVVVIFLLSCFLFLLLFLNPFLNR